MPDHLEVLEDAIADVGYWRWWWWLPDRVPPVFGVEFGGTQLWSPPASDGEPPSGVIVLAFVAPTLVAFLTDPPMPGQAEPVPGDWPAALREDRIGPFNISERLLTLRSARDFDELVAGMALQACLIGTFPPPTPQPGSAFLALRAQPVGLAICAAEMRVANRAGLMSPEQIVEAHERWWSYWSNYWRSKHSANPMPRDYTCEVTIPPEELELGD
jgi:hypothetical protein